MKKRLLCYDEDNPIGVDENGVLNPNSMSNNKINTFALGTGESGFIINGTFYCGSLPLNTNDNKYWYNHVGDILDMFTEDFMLNLYVVTNNYEGNDFSYIRLIRFSHTYIGYDNEHVTLTYTLDSGTYTVSLWRNEMD